MEAVTLNTIEDAVKAAQENKDLFLRNENEQTVEFNNQVRHMLLEKAGLEPVRIDGRGVAIFNYNGGEVRMSVYREDYNYWSVKRIDACPKCGEDIWTTRVSLSLESIGELLIEPVYETWDHHCKEETPSLTIEERLISVLREFIQQEGQS
jgi:hypothetical protein